MMPLSKYCDSFDLFNLNKFKQKPDLVKAALIDLTSDDDLHQSDYFANYNIDDYCAKVINFIQI